MLLKKIIAELLAVTCGFFFTIASAMVLGGVIFNLFLPPFIVGGVIFYFFARAWLYQVLELPVKKL